VRSLSFNFFFPSGTFDPGPPGLRVQTYLVTRHVSCNPRAALQPRLAFCIVAQHFHTPSFWMHLQTCRCPLSQSSALSIQYWQRTCCKRPLKVGRSTMKANCLVARCTLPEVRLSWLCDLCSYLTLLVGTSSSYLV